MDLGWVDFDLGVPPSCLAAQSLLPNFQQPKQNWADSRMLKIQVYPTQSTSRWGILYCLLSNMLLDTSDSKGPNFKLHHRNVEPGTFRNLDSLTALNLERNIIQKFSAGVFEGVTDTLSSLSLLNNLLTEYPIAAINSLKELRVSKRNIALCSCI